MPKPKARSAPADPPSLATMHGARAYGARFLRPGFARTPELDLAFALGHGGPATLTVAPRALRADLEPAKIAKAKIQDARDHRNVAIHLLRHPRLLLDVATEPDAWRARVAEDPEPAPIDGDEAEDIVRRGVPVGSIDALELRALEAMVGPSPVLRALVDALLAVPRTGGVRASWGNNTLSPILSVAHGLTLRVPEDERDAARARLEELRAAVGETHGGRYLVVSLDGAAGIRARGYKYVRAKDMYAEAPGSDDPASTFDLAHVDGDPAFVAASFAALWAAFAYAPRKWMATPSSSRIFFLGGEGALDTELRVVDAYPKTMQADALESYRELRGERAARLVLRLTRDGGAVVKQAKAWLAEHDAWTRPLLEAWAGSADPDAALAAACLQAR